MQLKPTTPRSVTRSIREFLSTLEIAVTPVYLPFTFAAPDYEENRCLNNCEAEHKRTGAQIVFGWIVWELPSASFIECVFHAVVQRDGQLIDITPRQDNEERILFVPDAVRVARRETIRSWETWSSHKRRRRLIEPTEMIVIENPQDNIL